MAGISAFDNEVYVKSSEKFKNTTVTNVGSILTAGNNLGIQAGRDISIMGSAVQADNDATLIAGRDVNLIPGREQYSSSLVKKRSSLGASGSLSESGVSGFMGTTTVEQGVTRTGDYTAGSYLGAGNDVLIKAGRDVNQIGSHIEAGRDVVVDAGQDWNMLASYDNETLSQYHKEVRTGVTGAIRQNVSSTVRTLIDLPQDAQAGEGGLGYSALTAASAGLRAVSAVTSSTSSPVSVSAKAGSSYSRTKYESSSSAARPSSVAAGRDVIASAGRDITIEGGQIAGGRDVVLDAGRDLTITSAKNSGDSRFSSINGGAGVGAKATVGSNGMAVGVNVQANAGGAGSKSDYTSHVNALIMAGETLSTSSGRDTSITGAHLEGENLWMDVGRDLTVASLQDHYDSKNYSWNVGVDVTIGYGVAVGVDLGVGFGKSKSDWTGQQTSLIGRSDVDIYTGKNTHLEGAIIATRPGGSLLLDTGTLTFEDVDDKNKGYQIGLGGSFSMNVGGEGFGNEKLADTPLGPIKAIDNGGPKAETPTGQRPYTPNSVEMQYSSHDMQAVLRPTITDGTIIIRDKPETSLAGLNRDIEKAREITKNEKVNVDVYIDPAAIEAVIGAAQFLWEKTQKQTDVLAQLDEAATKKNDPNFSEEKQLETFKEVKRDAAESLEKDLNTTLAVYNIEKKDSVTLTPQQNADTLCTVWYDALIRKYGSLKNAPALEINKILNAMQSVQQRAKVAELPDSAALKGNLVSSTNTRIPSLGAHDNGLGALSAFMAGVTERTLKHAYDFITNDGDVSVGKYLTKGYENVKDFYDGMKEFTKDFSNNAKELGNKIVELVKTDLAEFYENGHDPNNLENDYNFGKSNTGSFLGLLYLGVIGKVAKVPAGGATVAVEEISSKNFFEGAYYSNKVKVQSSLADYHGFPAAVDTFSSQGTVSKIIGADGKPYWKLEVPGGYKGKNGVFEYIRDANGKINHRLFKEK